jgi:hypothetical protein
MAITVQFAVFGALPGGSSTDAKAADVKGVLQGQINLAAGVVQISTKNLTDPCPNNVKHFAAVIDRDGTEYYFACEENQTIDFNSGGTSALKVQFAAFGALAGSSTQPQAADVSGVLQEQLYLKQGVVQISTQTLGDPAPNSVKHFAALVERGGTPCYFACQEGQTIDFNQGGN